MRSADLCLGLPPAIASPPPLGHSKNLYGHLLAAKISSKMEANLGSKKLIFEAYVGLHFGEVLATLGRHRAFFWRSKSLPKTASMLEVSWYTF